MHSTDQYMYVFVLYFSAFKRDASRLMGIDMINGVGVGVGVADGVMNEGTTGGSYGSGGSYYGSGGTSYHQGVSSTRGVWRLVHAEGHVLFPGSDHLETFAVFDRVVA